MTSRYAAAWGQGEAVNLQLSYIEFGLLSSEICVLHHLGGQR